MMTIAVSPATSADTPRRPAPRAHALSLLAGGRTASAYQRPPRSRRVPLALALGDPQLGGYGAGFAVTTAQGCRLVITLAQAVALLAGRGVEALVPRLSSPLPTFMALPTAAELGVSADEVVYALGVNVVLPLVARQRWHWCSGSEEYPYGALEPAAAGQAGFQLRARVGFPSAPHAFDPGWILDHAGVCIGVRRSGFMVWCSFTPGLALAAAVVGAACSADQGQPAPTTAVAAD